MTRVEIRPRPDGVPGDLGRPVLPGSKSHAQRAMLLAAGTSDGVLLRGTPASDDVVVLGRALAELGVDVAWRDTDLWVGGGLREGARATVHLGENGTALRCLPLVVAMLGGALTADGAPGLARRPLGPLLALLGQAGVRPTVDRLPLSVDGSAAHWPEHLTVDARITTQVATGALLGLALRARAGLGGGLVVAEAPAAAGYLALTARVLEAFGHRVECEPRGGDLWFRVGGAGAPPTEYRVPTDPSAVAWPLGLAALHGLPIDPCGDVDPEDPHPDLQVGADLARLAATGAGEHVVLADLASRPDTFPALCAVAAMRAGETVFAGVPTLRLKESDRLAAMARGLAAAGGKCDELEDGLVVRGPLPSRPEIVEIPTAADHRVVMALALLGTVLPGGVALAHAEAASKSWPGFFAWLGQVADVRYCGVTST